MVFRNFKQKKVVDFDFTQKNISKKNKKSLHWSVKYLLSFLGIQFLFLGYNEERLISYTQSLARDSDKTFLVYKNLDEALISGNQENIINNFISLNSGQSFYNDLISANTIKKIYANEINIDGRNNTLNYKITPETTKTLVSIYNHKINSGLLKEQENFDNLSCFFLDMTCYIGKSDFQKTWNKVYTNQKNIMDGVNYDIAHPEEYKLWQTMLWKQMSEGKVTISSESPGARLAKEKKI